MSRGIQLIAAAALFGLARGAPVAAQEEADFLRIGVTLGSTSFVGIAVEYVWDQTAAEVTLGTWALRDFSVSVVGKQYLGEGRVRGYLGLGLWNVTAFEEEGIGSGLVLRAPVGGELRTFESNWFGLDVSVNRALLVKRADPEDDTPPRSSIVPLPGFYWKWGHRRAGDGY